MILVLNCGSQSIKWKIFDLPRRQAGKKLKLVNQGKCEVLNSENFENDLMAELGKITEEIEIIGHRVVHGGGIFTKPLEITEENLQELEKINHLAPLHNPYNLLGIKVCQKVFTKSKNVAVFDTEFFANLPEVALTYALPENIAKEFGFKRYGFHGISHEYVSKKIKAKKIISVHLGGGASICAIKNGKVVDTSMGFTPMEGLVMMTRAGDIDAGIVLELVKQFGVEGADKILNKESGIKGICGENEFLKVLARIKDGDEQAKLAFNIFVYNIQKYIGAYFAILGGCDVLIFTGAIGAGNPKTRNAILSGIKNLKIKKVLAIETDEELAIAQKIIKIK
jgi:acetate kinase